MKTSEQTDKIDAAMAQVQATLAPIAKNKTVDTSRGGDSEKGWKSSFTTLDALYTAAHDALTTNKVVIYQGGDFVQGIGAVLVTRLACEGQWIQSFFPVKTSRDGAQGFGGGITFARRWGLCCMVGLVPADIEEGQGYKDAARENKAPRRAAAPGGLGALLTAIREADVESVIGEVQKARAAHPTGEGSRSVEQTIGAWFVNACANVSSIDGLTLIRDAANRIKPQGGDVRAAINGAAARLEPR